MRYFIEFAYKGTRYHGWQLQPNAVSVQEVLNKALSVLLNQPIETVGAGRTDSGVHARQMFAHFNADQITNTQQLIYKLNSYLPNDIAVHDIISVKDDAHSRFDAASRTYEYHIHTSKDPFATENSWYFTQPVDVDLMNQAAQILLQHRDFECFSKVNTDVHTFNCNISYAFWHKEGDLLKFTITADRFLRNMVRAIVGTLINIGLKKISLHQFEEIIRSKDRKKAGSSVPAHGLFLTQIQYDYINRGIVTKPVTT